MICAVPTRGVTQRLRHLARGLWGPVLGLALMGGLAGCGQPEETQNNATDAAENITTVNPPVDNGAATGSINAVADGTDAASGHTRAEVDDQVATTQSQIKQLAADLAILRKDMDNKDHKLTADIKDRALTSYVNGKLNSLLSQSDSRVPIFWVIVLGLGLVAVTILVGFFLRKQLRKTIQGEFVLLAENNDAKLKVDLRPIEAWIAEIETKPWSQDWSRIQSEHENIGEKIVELEKQIIIIFDRLSENAADAPPSPPTLPLTVPPSASAFLTIASSLPAAIKIETLQAALVSEYCALLAKDHVPPEEFQKTLARYGTPRAFSFAEGQLTVHTLWKPESPQQMLAVEISDDSWLLLPSYHYFINFAMNYHKWLYAGDDIKAAFDLKEGAGEIPQLALVKPCLARRSESGEIKIEQRGILSGYERLPREPS